MPRQPGVEGVNNGNASALYDNTIYPLRNYRIAGILWNQGETNAGRPDEYRKLLPVLIEGWRRNFGNVPAVIFGHALKNAMLPVITMMALQLSSMMSGAVITESIFAIPGIGRLATQAIQNRDMPMLQGTILFTTVIVIIGNLVADLLYGVLDPRIRNEV